jgi:integrase
MEHKGLKVFPDGRWLIQVQRYGISRTKRGEGGERAGVRELEKIRSEIEREHTTAEAARHLGVKLTAEGKAPGVDTFGDLFTNRYEPWARTELDPATWKARESTHRHLIEFFGDMPIGDIDAAVIDEFKDKRMKEGVVYQNEENAQNRKPRPLSKAGLAEQLKVLRAILGWAVKRGHLKGLPYFEMPREKRGAPGAAKPVRYFSEEERTRLLRRCKPGLANVIRFGLMTGCRPAEMFHLRCRSVDLKRRVLTLEEAACPLCHEGRWIPKVGAWRQVEIAPDLLPIVRSLMKGKRPEDLLIDNTHGAPYSRLRGSGGGFVKALRRAGLERQGLSFYSLRHTFGADLASAGISLEKIGKLMGHTDPRTTAIYAHIRPEALSGVVERLKLPDEWRPLGVVAHHPGSSRLSLVPDEAAAT